MKFKLLLLLLIVTISFAFAPGDEKKLPKEQSDESKYTNVGNIGLSITNFGLYGNGLRLITQPNHPPSCEYPAGSGIEHIFAGGIWVGGYKKDAASSNTKTGPFVSTGAVDASSLVRGGGFEFTNDKQSKLIERSSLVDSRYYNPEALSHQDFIAEYTDTNSYNPNDGMIIVDHDPLGVSIRQESYAWNFPFADFFVIMNYSIRNVSGKYLDSVYVGLWTDAVVRNTKVTTTTNTAFYSHGGDGYDDSLRMAYEYDADGDVGYTDSYAGFLFLGSEPALPVKFSFEEDSISSTCFNSWTHNNSTDPNFFAPQDDIQRYHKMQGWFGGTNRYGLGNGINPQDLKIPSNRSLLITHGYFRNIAPGDSINVVFAIVCGKKYGTEPAILDTREQRTILYNNADWALRAYFGNDRNRNGIIEPNEDLFGDGKIHRYVLPAPPTVPITKVIPEKNKATIYWDKRAEKSIDPISGKEDFGGYRIYRTQTGSDLTEDQDLTQSLVVLAQFDSAGSSGYNTGFNSIELNEPVMFDGDTTKYYYKYELPDLLNGWQYLFTVTAFDKGDPANNLGPLESSLLTNISRVIPGTVPNESENQNPGIYPNPYYGNAIWDGSSERLRKIYFFNLPEDCQITIYTLAGDVIKRLDHNQTSTGADIRWFDQYSDGNQKFTGGEHAWDLITDNDQAVATGLYLFTVKNNRNGDVKTGKFLIIK